MLVAPRLSRLGDGLMEGLLKKRVNGGKGGIRPVSWLVADGRGPVRILWGD